MLALPGILPLRRQARDPALDFDDAVELKLLLEQLPGSAGFQPAEKA